MNIAPPVEKDAGRWKLKSRSVYSKDPGPLTAVSHRQLANTEEFIDGNCTGSLGEVLVRCNNVLYIKGGEEDDEEAEPAMQQ